MDRLHTELQPLNITKHLYRGNCMKKILILSVIIMLLIGCDETYTITESDEMIPTINSINNTVLLIEEVENFASIKENGLLLGAIQISVSENKECRITFMFSKIVTHEKRSIRYDVDYLDGSGIVHTQYVDGHPKAASPFEEAIDFYSWKIGFKDGIETIVNNLSLQGIENNYRINCHCFEDVWMYTVFSSGSPKPYAIDTLTGEISKAS